MQNAYIIKERGFWIEEKLNSYTQRIYCSKCNHNAPFIAKNTSNDPYNFQLYGEYEKTNYCPNCGAKMYKENL